MVQLARSILERFTDSIRIYLGPYARKAMPTGFALLGSPVRTAQASLYSHVHARRAQIPRQGGSITQ